MARTKQTAKKSPAKKYKKATFKKKQSKLSSSQRGSSGACGRSGRGSRGVVWQSSLSRPASGWNWQEDFYSSDDDYWDWQSYNFDSDFDDDHDEVDSLMGHDDLDDEVSFGMLNGTIVGLQYYSGTVNPNEYVALEREPNNQYDINAIKVKNVGNTQVGHIKRDLARPLAFIVDKGLARIEGIVPSGMKNLYSLQVELSLWGKPENYRATADKLKSCGFYLMGGEGSLPGKSGASSSSGASAMSSMGPAPPIRTYLSPSEVKNELDKLFENIKEGDKTTCADPAEAISTPLYPHQKQALNWLKCQENNTALPPFWQEKNKRFFNSVLNFTTDVKPNSVKGGILADDMGLGKTLEMITLIVTNFVDGKPLAKPVAGLVRQSKLQKNATEKAKILSAESVMPKAPAKKVKLIMGRCESQSCHTLGEMHPLLGGADDDGAGVLPRQPEHAVSVEQDTLGKKPFPKEDPDYCPEEKEVNLSVAAATDSRPRRSSKRPTRYVYSSDEDELINEQTPVKKAKQGDVQGKAAATGSTSSKGTSGSLEVRFDSGAGNDSGAEQGNKDGAAIDIPKEEAKSSVDTSKADAVPLLDLPDLDKITSSHRNKDIGNGDDLPDLETLENEKTGENISEMKASLFKKLGQELEKVSDGGEPFWTVIAESPAVDISRKQQKEIELSKKPGLEFLDMLSERSFTVSQLRKMFQCANMMEATSLLGQHLHTGENISEMKASLFKKLGQELEKVSDGGEPFWTVIAESPAVDISRKQQKEIELSKKPGLEFLDMLSERSFTVSQLRKMFQCANMMEATSLLGQHLHTARSSQTSSMPASKIKTETDTSAGATSSGSQLLWAPSTSDYCSTDTVVISDCNKPSTLEIGPSTGRTETAGPRCTLIVCPLSVLSNWLTQFEEHLHRGVHLAIYLYYGHKRVRDSAMLEKHDVILTTYSTVAADFKKNEKNALSKVKWLRIVLDEGHTIKNPNAQQTKAINQLKAERKWVLTGTPIQNSMKDLWSLINFLQVNPFTDRHWWTRTIERPLERGDAHALTKIQYLMGLLSLRRTKTQEVDGKPLVVLPERRVYIEHIELTPEERAVYEAMQKDGRLIVSKYCSQGTLLHNYSQVLAILMRLRQICCHPFLVAKAAKAVKETLASLDDHSGPGNEELRQKLISTLIMVLNSGTDEECAVCLDSLKAPVITPCAHVYCRPCIENVIRSEQGHAKCPLCRGDIKQDKLLEVPPEKQLGEGGKGTEGEDVMTVEQWKSSAKVDALKAAHLKQRMEDRHIQSVVMSRSQASNSVDPDQTNPLVDALMAALLKQRSEDRHIKSVVVSQFTSLLTLLEIPLRTNGFSFVRLDGTMTTRARTEAIKQISDPSPGSPTIMLLSLKAGGVGINLTAACRVFLLDPAWNPAVEEQCFDRCHRLGQKNDVIVTKFIVDDSVETRMLELQERKRKLMQGAFGLKQTADQKRQERIRDIKTLLDI